MVDDHVRAGLRLHDMNAQYVMRSITDLGLALSVSFPIMVDSILVAYWYRGSADVGLQMGLIDLEAFTLVGAIEGLTNFFSGRERPYVSECGAGRPDKVSDCATDTRRRSFFSGHTAVSFTSAALICAHHEALRLFDNGWDHVTCAAGFVAAGAIGTMRLLGDAHYFSDVVVGALVGMSVGLLVPLWHHYGGTHPKKSASDFKLNVVPGLGGATLAGTF